MSPHSLNLAIEIEGVTCGSIGALPGVAERAHVAELGYWLGRRYWGQGWMQRVVALFAPWAMQELTLYRLQAEVLDFNQASARVLLGNGFVEEGTARAAVFKRGQLYDLRRFGLTRSHLD